MEVLERDRDLIEWVLTQHTWQYDHRGLVCRCGDTLTQTKRPSRSSSIRHNARIEDHLRHQADMVYAALWAVHKTRAQQET